MRIKNVYGYDQETFEYRGMIPTQLDPRESEIQNKDIWLTPPNTTEIPPDLMSLKEGCVFVFDPVKKNWIVKEDHRGVEVYNALTHEFTKIKEFGPIEEPIFELDKLPYPRDLIVVLDWKDGKFVVDSKRDVIVEFINQNHKTERDYKLAEDIIDENGVPFKTDLYSCQDYERVISLDLSIDNWISSNGTVVHMDKDKAKEILQNIQIRKATLVANCAAVIERTNNYDSDQLIHELTVILQ